MDESLTERRRVGEEGFRIVKPCQGERNAPVQTVRVSDGTSKGSTGQLRASSRGNT